MDTTTGPLQHPERDEGHIVADFVDVVTAQWRPSPSRPEYLVRHLVACDECARALDAILRTLASDRIPRDKHWSAARQLLQRLREAAIEERAQQLAAHVDMRLLDEGAAPSSDYQALAEHLANCRACREDVERMSMIVRDQRAAETLVSHGAAGVRPPAEDTQQQGDVVGPEDAHDPREAATAPGASAEVDEDPAARSGREDLAAPDAPGQSAPPPYWPQFELGGSEEVVALHYFCQDMDEIEQMLVGVVQATELPAHPMLVGQAVDGFRKSKTYAEVATTLLVERGAAVHIVYQVRRSLIDEVPVAGAADAGRGSSSGSRARDLRPKGERKPRGGER